jgi:hypothetical protein
LNIKNIKNIKKFKNILKNFKKFQKYSKIYPKKSKNFKKFQKYSKIFKKNPKKNPLPSFELFDDDSSTHVMQIVKTCLLIPKDVFQCNFGSSPDMEPDIQARMASLPSQQYCQI